MMRPVLFTVILLAGIPAVTLAADTAAPKPEAHSAISREPFYASIVDRAGKLEHQTDGFATKSSLSLLTRPDFQTYAAAIRTLSADDLKGHYDLRVRGTDSDLKCILLGVSRDLNLKMDAIQAAKSDSDLATALGNMSGLLSDNIDVIVTPASADSGLDCVIEFGKGA